MYFSILQWILMLISFKDRYIDETPTSFIRKENFSCIFAQSLSSFLPRLSIGLLGQPTVTSWPILSSSYFRSFRSVARGSLLILIEICKVTSIAYTMAGLGRKIQAESGGERILRTTPASSHIAWSFHAVYLFNVLSCFGCQRYIYR